MNTKHEYFLELVKQESFSKAAEKLFISQPSLSHYINSLEKDLGIQLFNRKKFPVKLTLAGEKYLDFIQKELALSKQLHNELEDIKNSISGKVKVGIHYSLGSSMLSDLLPIFMSKYPKIKIELEEGTSTSYLQNCLENDEIDCGLFFVDPLYTQSSYEPLVNARIFAVGHKNHPLAQNEHTSINNPKVIPLESIVNEPLIVLKKNQYLRKMADQLFSKNNLKSKNIFTTSNPTTAISLAAVGIGLTFIPEIYIKHNIEKDNLSYFTIKNHPLWWTLNIVYNKSGYVSNAAEKFITTAKEFYGDYSETRS